MYSRYSTFANNPLKYRDPIGRDTLSFTGSNGKKFSIIHKDLPKNNITLPTSINIDKDITLNLNDSDTKIDVVGYNLTATASYSTTNRGNATNTASFHVSKNYAVFTNGEYHNQPFPYFVVGGESGLDATGDNGVNISGTFSIYIASAGKKQELTPQSWEGSFAEISIGATGFSIEGGGGMSVTGFSSPHYDSNNTGYIGVSMNFTIGIGVGQSEGADLSLFSTAGFSYYKLAEIYPTKTNKLLNSYIGILRYHEKWQDFMTGGRKPGTLISDGLHLGEKAYEWFKNKIKH